MGGIALPRERIRVCLQLGPASAHLSHPNALKVRQRIEDGYELPSGAALSPRNATAPH